VLYSLHSSSLPFHTYQTDPNSGDEGIKQYEWLKEEKIFINDLLLKNPGTDLQRNLLLFYQPHSYQPDPNKYDTSNSISNTAKENEQINRNSTQKILLSSYYSLYWPADALIKNSFHVSWVG